MTLLLILEHPLACGERTSHLKPELSLVLRTSESLSLEWPRESNQREGHPSRPPAHIRVRRASIACSRRDLLRPSMDSPAVLAQVGPPNNSYVPVLKQFGYYFEHPALRPFGAGCAVRAAPAAQSPTCAPPRRPLRGTVGSGAHRARQKQERSKRRAEQSRAEREGSRFCRSPPAGDRDVGRDRGRSYQAGSV